LNVLAETASVNMDSWMLSAIASVVTCVALLSYFRSGRRQENTIAVPV
jgi:hypothetical protein